jgi:hypothetical protein
MLRTSGCSLTERKEKTAHATSRGKQRTALKVDGRSIFVIANAFLEVNQTNGTHSAKPEAKQSKKQSAMSKGGTLGKASAVRAKVPQNATRDQVGL